MPLNVSLFHGSIDPRPVRILTLGQVLDAIQHGTYRQAVRRGREILGTQGLSAYTVAKRALPAVTFGGTFAPTRAKAHLTRHAGLVHGDLDHIEHVEAVKARLAADQHIIYCFVSPSGTGLKLGVRVPLVTDDVAYKHAWQAVANAHQQAYGLTWDASGKDISRLCYMSHDPNLYRNRDARPFPVPEPRPFTPKPTPTRLTVDIPRDSRERYGRQAIETAVAMIDASTPGNRHHARLRAAELLGGYIASGILGEAEAYSALKDAVERNSEHPERSMKTIAAGLHHGQERPITLADLEAERQAWLATHSYSDRNKPLKSEQPSAPGSTNVGVPYRGYRGYQPYRGYGREVARG